MVKVFFRNGNRHVDPCREGNPGLIEKCAAVTASGAVRAVCPEHRSGSRATLVVDIAPGSGELTIVDYCCRDFCGSSNGVCRPPGGELRTRTASSAPPDPRMGSLRERISAYLPARHGRRNARCGIRHLVPNLVREEGVMRADTAVEKRGKFPRGFAPFQGSPSAATLDQPTPLTSTAVHFLSV